MLTPLLLAAALVPPSTEADSSRVAPRVVERRLELDLDPSALNWSGNLVATFEVRGTTRRIRLRFDASRVSRVGLADARGEVSAGWGTDAGGLFMVEADRDLAPGQARLEVDQHLALGVAAGACVAGCFGSCIESAAGRFGVGATQQQWQQ